MNYKIKDGFTMIKVCDTHLLVASRSHWRDCVGIRPIPKKYALCWALMEQGKTSDEVIQNMADLFKRPVEEFAGKLASVFTNLAKDGYLEEIDGNASDNLSPYSNNATINEIATINENEVYLEDAEVAE